MKIITIKVCSAYLLCYSVVAIFLIQTSLYAEPTPEQWYVESRSYGTRQEPEPPRYVTRHESLPEWVDLGVEYRMRYEYRDSDLRKPVIATDNPILHRTRAYFGIREILDPFRFGVEVAEARRANSQFPADDRDVNRFDILQAFGELYFKDAIGENRPFRLQGGRLAFEYLDRRLIARNEWRNTTNTFAGWRAILGQKQNDWQLDLLAVRPVKREIIGLDEPDMNRKLYGAIGDWRRWSDIATIQPYYFFLNQHKDSSRPTHEAHSLGFRSYGIIPKTSYDFDLDFVSQFGRTEQNMLRAYAVSSELGYTWEVAMKPRLSGFFGYATGDREPNDTKDQHFDRLFGFARPWSSNDYIAWENILTPKTRLEFQPYGKIRVDTGYSAYWLASAKDSWATVNLRDETGDSGKFLGHEFDLRIRTPLHDRVDLNVGYAHFFSGEYPKNLGKASDTDFFYCETTVRLF